MIEIEMIIVHLIEVEVEVDQKKFLVEIKIEIDDDHDQGKIINQSNLFIDFICYSFLDQEDIVHQNIHVVIVHHVQDHMIDGDILNVLVHGKILGSFFEEQSFNK